MPTQSTGILWAAPWLCYAWSRSTSGIEAPEETCHDPSCQDINRTEHHRRTQTAALGGFVAVRRRAGHWCLLQHHRVCSVVADTRLQWSAAGLAGARTVGT